jgi:hypothetical protein
MISIISNKDAFEKIVFWENENFPNWNKIINGNIDIFLDLTEDEIEEELSNDESPVYLALQAYQAIRRPLSKKEFFQNFQKNEDHILNFPRAVFLLNRKEEDCLRISEKYGLSVFSGGSLQDNFNDFLIEEEFQAEDRIRCDRSGKEGWCKVMDSFKKEISNSVIFIDRNFFSNEERNVNVGIDNLKRYLDSTLPQDLAIAYHVLIVIELSSKFQRAPFRIKVIETVNNEITALRKYPIIVETLFIHSSRPVYEYTHERRVLMNYHVGKAEHGFSVFAVKDKSQVRTDNNFNLSGVMHSLVKRDSVINKKTAMKLIKRLKQIKDDAEIKLTDIGQHDYHYFLYNGKEEQITIQNRLLN